jgi:hypothetical protein
VDHDAGSVGHEDADRDAYGDCAYTYPWPWHGYADKDGQPYAGFVWHQDGYQDEHADEGAHGDASNRDTYDYAGRSYSAATDAHGAAKSDELRAALGAFVLPGQPGPVGTSGDRECWLY